MGVVREKEYHYPKWFSTQNRADWLQSRGFGPCRLRGLPTICRVLYQAQGWRETFSSGGKLCPLWGLEGLGIGVVRARVAIVNFALSCAGAPR